MQKQGAGFALLPCSKCHIMILFQAARCHPELLRLLLHPVSTPKKFLDHILGSQTSSTLPAASLPSWPSSPCSASPGPHMHSPPVISSPSTTLSSANVCFPKVLSWEGRLVRQHTSAGNTLLAHPILHPMGSLTSAAGRAQSPTNCEAKASNSSAPPAWLKSPPFPSSAQAETPPAEPDNRGPHCSIPSQEAALPPHRAPSELVQSLRAEGCCMAPALHLPVSKACWFISATQSSSASSKASWGL